MVYITLLSSVLSLFLIAIFADVQDIIVDKYHIDIELYPEIEKYLEVTCFIVFANSRKTQEISMYIDNVEPFPTVLILKKDSIVQLDTKTVFNPTTKILTVVFKEEIEPGFYVMKYTSLELFVSAFNQVYSDRIHQKEVMWLSYSYFQPIWIQRIIPCWIKPKEDISLHMPTFRLSILHFAHHSVLTNMPISEERLDEKALRSDMKRTDFDTTPPMSPYQLSIVVTNFTHVIVDEDDVVSMWCRNRSASSLRFALAIARNITAYLDLSKESLSGRFSPMRLKLIVIPKIQSYSKEIPERNDNLVHPGIIIVNENDITYNKENDTIGRKYNVIRLIGYEIMREYYERIVNPFWDPSTWLSKGFTMFIATHIFNQTLPNFRMIYLFVVQIQHECLDFDVDKSMLPFPGQDKTIPMEIVDNMKASVILRMLQHTFNAEGVWKAIDTFTYNSTIHNKEIHLELFWAALQDAHDKIDPGAYDIKGFMHPWIEQKGYLVLTVIRNYDTSAGAMNVSIENLNIPEDDRAIPVTYTTRQYLNFNQTQPHTWIPPIYKPYHKIFNLNYLEESWVIFNIQQAGYYRVKYDDENWARISEYLNNGTFWKIHVLNRAQLIDDAFHFMLLGQLRADIFWKISGYLKRETNYIAWYPMFKAIEYMSNSFVFFKEDPTIKLRLAMILYRLLNIIKCEEQLRDNDFTKALRQEAAQWMCRLKLDACKPITNYLLVKHLKNNTKLSPWWKKWTYCYGSREADNITWHQTLNKINGNDNDKILYLLTCPNHLVKIDNYTSTTYTYDNLKLHITLSTIVQLELRNFVYTIEKIFYKPYTDNTIFINILDNLALIKFGQLKMSTAILILINNINSIDQVKRINETNAFKGLEADLYQITNKLEARKSQLENSYRLFTIIQPSYIIFEFKGRIYERGRCNCCD